MILLYVLSGFSPLGEVQYYPFCLHAGSNGSAVCNLKENPPYYSYHVNAIPVNIGKVDISYYRDSIAWMHCVCKLASLSPVDCW